MSSEDWWLCKRRLPTTQERVFVICDGYAGIAWLGYDGKWNSEDLPDDALKTVIAWTTIPDFSYEVWNNEVDSV